MQPRHQSSTVKGIPVASARRTEMPQLAAPQPVKALPEHTEQSEEEASQAQRFSYYLGPRPDRHTHSLGYGIDE